MQFDPLTFFATYRALQKSRPDIVHLHNGYLLTFAPVVAARLLRIPVAMSIYDYWPFCPLSTLFDDGNKACRAFHGTGCLRCLPPQMRLIQRVFLAVRRAVIDRFLAKVDRFIVLSESSRGILEDYGIESGRIETVPVSIPEEFGPAADGTASGGGNPVRGKTVLFIGWMQKRKGLHVLLDAMQRVWNDSPDAHLVIVTQDVKWEDDFKRGIEECLKAVSPFRYTYISGQRPREEIRSRLAEAEIVVIPEQWENMSPLLVIEAMFMGKAIVASRIGGIPEFIEDGRSGLLFEPTEAGDLAAKLGLLLSNRRRAEEMGRAAAERIAELQRRSMPEQKMVALYERLLRREGPASDGVREDHEDTTHIPA